MSRAQKSVAVVALSVLLAVAFAWWFVRPKPIPAEVLGAAESGLARPLESARVASRARAYELAVNAAETALVDHWLTLAADPDAHFRDGFLSAVARRDVRRAEQYLTVWRPGAEDLAAEQSGIVLDILQRRFEDARARAWAGAESNPNERSAFMRLWYRAHADDPEYMSPEQPLRLLPGVHSDRFRNMDRASSVLVRAYLGEETVGVLKPEQTYPYSSYRGEVAAFRLCPIIHCAFSVPHNDEVRIHEDDLVTLFHAERFDDVAAIRRHDSRMTFYPDQEGTRWLYGTFKAWVPGFSQFPIEHIELWRDLVDGSTSARRLERMDWEEALPGFEELDFEKWEAFMLRVDDVSVFEFAHQLSDMHVFDLLINNWDRYSSSYPASNCQWNHGQFVSLDNGASFQTPEEWEGHEVQLRIHRIRRFSRQTIDAIRWMEPEALRPILFPPNPYVEGEDAEWEAFLARRVQLLEHVDELITRYGEDRILIFP